VLSGTLADIPACATRFVCLDPIDDVVWGFNKGFRVRAAHGRRALPLPARRRGELMKILLVEDHEEIWDFVSRRLRRRGFEVVVATDGQQGVDMAGAEHPDIVLLDMNLPILDGWTVAGKIKGDAGTATIPIIALTAHAMSGDREKALAAGCDDYHPKPIDFARLLTQIEALAGTPKPDA
jgi:two-component system, cell cycle response regulator DivK